MNQHEAEILLNKVASGEVSVAEAVSQMKMEPFKEIGDFAKIDLHRGVRQGVAEVIYGEGKSAEQIQTIIGGILASRPDETILITRLSAEKAHYIMKKHSLMYCEAARIGTLGPRPKPYGMGKILVVTGGTSDVPVAEEAAITAEMLGNEVERIYDVGVAGIHRLLAHVETIMEAKVIIAVAGMEGALPSVVGGMVSCPVIAVPTSIGYGASMNGIAALLAMLNSCASGISVVNIDNGFGAGYLASTINHLT